MKKLFFLLAVLLSLPAFSQKNAVDDLFNQYALKDGFITVTVSKGALDLLAAMEQDEEFKEMASSIRRIRILATDGLKGKSLNMDFYKELLPNIPAGDYKELLHVRGADQNVIILVKEREGIINDFLMLVGGEDNALISIQGNMDMKKLGQLSSTLPGSGLHHLEKADL
jgi:hypothetical protein